MLKVTIEFPNGATVMLEATEADGYAEVVSTARDLLAVDQLKIASQSLRGNGTPTQPSEESGDYDRMPAINERFIEFCRELAPVGDMRRIVVAAEGAHRFLEMDRVSGRELNIIFDAVKWPKPKNFLQTLRNAGRSSFRWLERVPGSSGYYSVTERGRHEIIPAGVEVA